MRRERFLLAPILNVPYQKRRPECPELVHSHGAFLQLRGMIAVQYWHL